MSRSIGILTLLLSLSLLVALPCRAHSSTGLIAVGGTTIVRAVTRYFGREGSETAAEYLSKKGGRELAERVAASAARQGGDEAVEAVARLVSKHGPDALTALRQSDELVPLLRAIDELPAQQAGPALARLAAGDAGRELAQTTSRYGVKALTAEVAKPGLGGSLVRTFGDDGVELTGRLTNDQAIAIVRHSDDLQRLAPVQQSGLLSVLRRDAEAFTRFIARFVEANPGKTLFTAATTAIILQNPDAILGGDQIAYDADGNPILMSKRGLIDRTIETTGGVAKEMTDSVLKPIIYAAIAFGLIFSTFLMWNATRRDRKTIEG